MSNYRDEFQEDAPAEAITLPATQCVQPRATLSPPDVRGVRIQWIEYRGPGKALREQSGLIDGSIARTPCGHHHWRHRGIGTARCRALAEEGTRVVVGYNTSGDRARTLAESLPGEGHAALAVPVTDTAGLALLASIVGTRYGFCDILVNSAGPTRFVPHDDLQGLDDALIESILATNVARMGQSVPVVRS